MSDRAAPDWIVVGGGAIGAAVTYELARAGLAVRLLERGEIAGGASGAAAGMLAPIAEGAEPGPALETRLASFALFAGLVPVLREASGLDPEYVVSGSLRVAPTDAAADALRAEAERFAGHGLVWLSADDLAHAAPGIAPDVRARGGLLAARDAHVRSPLLTRAFVGAAERLGAEVTTGVAVRGLLRRGDAVVGVATSDGPIAAGGVVLCPGCFTAECASWIGSDVVLPVEPVRGQIVAVELPPTMPGPIVWGGETYLVPKLDGSLVIGATTERAGFDRRVTARGVAGLLTAAEALVPDVGGARFLGAWAGLRPDTPDHLPLVGAWPGLANLLLAAGHYRNGVLLAPLTARLVADAVLGKGAGEPAFDPARFV